MNISALRNVLFEQLGRLSNTKNNLDEENTRACAIVHVANAIIDTAKVEVEFLKATKIEDSMTGFFPQKKPTK